MPMVGTLAILLMTGSVLMAQSPIPCGKMRSSSPEPPDLTKLPPADAAMFTRSLSLIRHLPPAAFPEAPPHVRKILDQENCQIPQVYGDHRPGNLIRGEFALRGQTDWAALCS